MATTSRVPDINECPVCFEVYVKPQKLECDHSLCKSCLKRLTFNGVVKCPLCNKDSARKSVKPDFRLEQFIAILKEQEFVRKAASESESTGKSEKYKCQKASLQI